MRRKYQWRNITLDLTHFHLGIEPHFLKHELAEFLTLFYKGLGLIIGAEIVLNFHWIWVIILLLWLMFDFKVEFEEKIGTKAAKDFQQDLQTELNENNVIIT